MITKKRHSVPKRRNFGDKSKRSHVFFSQIGAFIYSHDLDRLLTPDEMQDLKPNDNKEDYN
jgi:hypothetical protein